MKKFFLFLSLAGIFSVMTSCKEDFVCTCLFHDTAGILPDITTTKQINDAKRSEAVAECEDGSSSAGSTSTVCTLN